jgi:DNA-directed RNA polymerase subunit M/transcription elongation factor TFIIS
MILFLEPPKCPKCGAMMIVSFLWPNELVCTKCSHRQPR